LPEKEDGNMQSTIQNHSTGSSEYLLILRTLIITRPRLLSREAKLHALGRVHDVVGQSIIYRQFLLSLNGWPGKMMIFYLNNFS
jgi:hypothetical protein